MDLATPAITATQTPRLAMGARLVCATPKRGRAVVNYSLGERLGKGASGTVFKAVDLKTGGVVAIKQISTNEISSLDTVMGEIELLQDLEHPNIVKYLGSMKEDATLHIVLEYCENGSLAAMCARFGVFPEQLVAVYMSQVLNGLEFLHQQGVIHRDVKGANILTTKDGIAKLADFGVATTTVKIANDPGSGITGTPNWIAPEIVLLQEPTAACDIWSLGCTVIELRTGRPPYSEFSEYAAMYAMVEDDMPPIPSDASGKLRDFLSLCFQKDPNLRYSAQQLKSHPWISRHAPQVSSAVANAAQTVKDWNSPKRRRAVQVPSRLNLRQTYEELDVPELPSKSEPNELKRGLLEFVEKDDDFNDFFGDAQDSAIPTGHHVADLSSSSVSGQMMSVHMASENIFHTIMTSTVGQEHHSSLAERSSAKRLGDFSDDDCLDDLANQIGQLDILSQPKKRVSTDWSDDRDPFEGFEELLDDAPDERVISAIEETNKLLRGISQQQVKPSTLEGAYARLSELMAAEPAIKRTLIQEKILAQALPAATAHPEISAPILELILLIVDRDAAALETFSLSDGLTALLTLGPVEPLRCVILLLEFAHSYSYGPRLLMSRKEIIGFVCESINKHGSAKQNSDEESAVIVKVAAQCILEIFENFGGKHREELWDTFGSMGLVRYIFSALEVDIDHPAIDHLYELVESFVKCPPAVIVKHLTKHLLRVLMKVFRRLPVSCQWRLKVLHFYKTVSSYSEVLAMLEKGQLAPHLILALRQVYQTHNSSLHAYAASLLPLFHNYCRLSPSRQLECAQNGLIPLLQQTAVVEPGLKEFSIPVFCYMAHNADIWQLMWEQGGLETLVQLIVEPGWEAPAVAAITAWMSGQPGRVKPKFLALGGMAHLMRAVRETRNEGFAGVITSLSTLVVKKVITDDLPTLDLFEALLPQMSRSMASTTLVKILRAVHHLTSGSDPAIIGALYHSGLFDLIKSLTAHEETSILSRRLAREIVVAAQTGKM